MSVLARRRIIGLAVAALIFGLDRWVKWIVTDTLRQPRISAVLIAGFATGALLLVAMGLFGLVSGSVAPGSVARSRAARPDTRCAWRPSAGRSTASPAQTCSGRRARVSAV